MTRCPRARPDPGSPPGPGWLRAFDLGSDPSMALINSDGFAHVRLTVTDIGRSKAFYDQVFGWPVAVDESAAAGEPGVTESRERFFGGTVYQTPQGTLFGLRPAGNRDFSPTDVGLDHVSFVVSSRDDLDRAAQNLTGAHIDHGEVTDLPDAGIAILSFQDPDNINVELTAPLS